MIAGGSKCPPPIFIFENNRKSNKIMHCVGNFFFTENLVYKKFYFIFICENNRKSNKIMHCVEHFF